MLKNTPEFGEHVNQRIVCGNERSSQNRIVCLAGLERDVACSQAAAGGDDRLARVWAMGADAVPVQS